MSTKSDNFVWYATHPVAGELIICCKPGSSHALIYSPRMVRERLGPNPNVMQCLELNLGPMGSIGWHIYTECGMTVSLPFKLRMAILFEAHRMENENTVEIKPEHSTKLTEFMLEAWDKHTLSPE